MVEDESPQAALGAARLDTFPKLLHAAAAAYGEEPAVVLHAETIPDDAISFSGLERASAELARALLGRGVGKGCRIGFIYGNSPTFAVLLAAIARIGAIAIPLSTLVKADELVRVLRQSDVHGLIVQRSLLGHDYVDRLCDALPALANATSANLQIPDAPYLRWIVSDGADLPASIHPRSWLTDAAGGVSDAMLRAVEDAVHATDQLLEIYTSGSMAAPKGVKHLHGPVLFRADYIARMTKRVRGQEAAAILPMFWVGGLGIVLLPSLISGACTVCTEGTSTSSRHAMGSVLAADDLAMMAQATPYWALGMSETFGPYAYGDVLRADGFPLCAPLDHIAERYEVRVADTDDRPVGDGEVGEIQVRGYALTPGLHKFERADYFTADGYYRTGDLGLLDGPRIHFVGRSGDMIKTSGSNVSPAEVEQELMQIDGVQAAYVVGLPDARRGERVAAAIVSRDGTVLDFNDLDSHLRGRLSRYKTPQTYIQIAPHEVPMLPSNKVARRLIRDMIAERTAQEAV
ncbi:class I adenylate-forming enzyme family protein [Sphingomonas sp. BIUV-7]|uniref:Class I adenylate-forming enzyme family protein n=1 Tax=Sphingomonas natans TaxID=3063330 RepID=A0ABT8Y843_9SPHN|nr:class I adenylate-forming enzyme family protein [Sphingomonas sp. BIUV-7]MDO6414489.1 class I adenylate-forming enzyme family protein [Sphingomonas sp. BIUV-7]